MDYPLIHTAANKDASEIYPAPPYPTSERGLPFFRGHHKKLGGTGNEESRTQRIVVSIAIKIPYGRRGGSVSSTTQPTDTT